MCDCGSPFAFAHLPRVWYDGPNDGAPGRTGTLYTTEKCECGFVFPEGSYESEYETE